MIGRKKSLAFASLGAACVGLGMESESHAQLCNLFNRPAPQTAVTTYRPLYAPAPVMATSVNYMPYTAYRAVYMPTPITTLQPAPACSACGGATTVMRPVVSYAMRPQLLPYTTYVAAPAAPLMATPVVAALPVVSTPVAAPSCGCNAGIPATTSAPLASAPLAPAYTMQPGMNVGSLSGAANAAPALPPGQQIPMSPPPGNPSGMPGSTFAPQSGPSGMPSANYAPLTTTPPGTVIYREPGPYSAPNSAGASMGVPVPTVISPPNVISQPGGASSALGPASRIVPPSAEPGPTPKSTFKNPGPSDATTEQAPPSAAPSTRWTDRFSAPGPSDQNNNSNGNGSGSDSNSGSGSGGGSGSGSGGTVNPHETNFQQPRSSDGDDRMASMPQRQTTIYRPVSSMSPPVGSASNVALDDSVWHSAARP